MVWVTGLVLVRRKVRTPGAVDLEVGLDDDMATVLPPWTRPREIFCQATITAPCGRGAALHPHRCFGRLERRAGGAGGR